jgi:hypothetical protein
MTSKRKQNSTGLLIAVIALILLAAYLTNPGKELHKEQLKIKLTEVIGEAMQERQDNLIVYGAWEMAGGMMIEAFTENHMSVDNYFLFSLTRLHWDGRSYIIGIGGFGQVYITKRLDKELAEKIIDTIEDRVTDALPDFLK